MDSRKYNKVVKLLKLNQTELDLLNIVMPEEPDSDVEINQVDLEFDSDNDDKDKPKKKTKPMKVDTVEIKPLINVSEAYVESPHPQLFKPPFSLMVSAKKGSGKSTLLINLIQIYSQYFERIIIFSPTLTFDKNYQAALENDIIEIDDKFVFKRYSEKLLTNILKQLKKEIKKGNQRHTLIIFDDIVSDIPKVGKSKIETLARNQRHYLVSYIFISQEYRAMNVAMRKNCDGLVVFNSDVRLERKAIIEECSSLIGRNRFEKMWYDVCKERFKFLTVRPTEDDLMKKYSYCFQDFIDPFKYDNKRFEVSELYRKKTKDLPLEQIKEKIKEDIKKKE